jgi:hypothetical protein
MQEMTRGQLYDLVQRRFLSEPEFRDLVRRDPRRSLEAAIERKLPDWVEVKLLEERPDVVYLVIPTGSQDLRDEQLEEVAGGKQSFERGSGGTFVCEDADGKATYAPVQISELGS